MFEGLIEQIILSYFGDYIENLDHNKLSLGLWSGTLELEDIFIRAQAINKLKLPFTLKFGKIKKLSLKIPWKSNFSYPTEITIDQIQIILNVLSNKNWEFIDYNSYENKLYYLMKFANERIYTLIQSFNKENEINNNNNNNYFGRILIKILDNLHINFKNINIRIEDVYNKISFGFTLKEILTVNTNENWEQEFIDRNYNKNINIYKLLKINFFGIYLIPNENNFISNSNDFEKDMNDFFNDNNIKYLIEPMCLTAKMKQNNMSDRNIENDARNTLFIHLEKFNFNIKKKQYDCIIKIINNINQYQNYLYEFNNTIQYKFFAPYIKINQIKELINNNNNNNENNNNNDNNNDNNNNNNEINFNYQSNLTSERIGTNTVKISNIIEDNIKTQNIIDNALQSQLSRINVKF